MFAQVETLNCQQGQQKFIIGANKSFISVALYARATLCIMCSWMSIFLVYSGGQVSGHFLVFPGEVTAVAC